MKAVQQFISISNSKCTVHQTALNYVLNFPGKLYILSVCGAARQGKSSILNILLRSFYTEQALSTAQIKQNGFKVSNNAEACTRGIQVWCDPIPFLDGSLLIMDSEGTGTGNDSDLGILTALLSQISSLVMFNIQNDFNNTSIQSLSIMSSVSRLSLGQCQRPPLVVLVRDAQLDIPNAKQYVGDALLVQGNDDQSMKQSKEGIRQMFSPVECSVIRYFDSEDSNAYPSLAKNSEFAQDITSTIKLVQTTIDKNARNNPCMVNAKVYTDMVTKLVEQFNSNCKVEVPKLVDSIHDAIVKSCFDTEWQSYSSAYSTAASKIQQSTSTTQCAQLYKEFSANAAAKSQQVVQSFNTKCTPYIQTVVVKYRAALSSQIASHCTSVETAYKTKYSTLDHDEKAAAAERKRQEEAVQRQRELEAKQRAAAAEAARKQEQLRLEALRIQQEEAAYRAAHPPVSHTHHSHDSDGCAVM